jgi:hypothetical protein
MYLFTLTLPLQALNQTPPKCWFGSRDLSHFKNILHLYLQHLFFIEYYLLEDELKGSDLSNLY